MFVSHNINQTIFCEVAPQNKEYGSKYPILTFYNDGSFSRQQYDDYYRSDPGYILKPHNEFTINELKDALNSFGPKKTQTATLTEIVDILETVANKLKDSDDTSDFSLKILPNKGFEFSQFIRIDDNEYQVNVISH